MLASPIPYCFQHQTLRLCFLFLSARLFLKLLTEITLKFIHQTHFSHKQTQSQGQGIRILHWAWNTIQEHKGRCVKNHPPLGIHELAWAWKDHRMQTERCAWQCNTKQRRDKVKNRKSGSTRAAAAGTSAPVPRVRSTLPPAPIKHPSLYAILATNVTSIICPAVL